MEEVGSKQGIESGCSLYECELVLRIQERFSGFQAFNFWPCMFCRSSLVLEMYCICVFLPRAVSSTNACSAPPWHPKAAVHTGCCASRPSTWSYSAGLLGEVDKCRVGVGSKKRYPKNAYWWKENEEKTFLFDPQPFTCLLSKRFGKDDLHWWEIFWKSFKAPTGQDNIKHNKFVVCLLWFMVLMSPYNTTVVFWRFVAARSIGSVLLDFAEKSDHLHSSEAL